MPNSDPRPPLTIRMHDRDNVAIVANDGGLPAGTVFPSGLTLREHVPQGHKVALVDLAEGGAVRALQRRRSATRCATDPGGQLGARAPAADAGARASSTACRSPRVKPAPLPPLEGYTFEGYRNADGSVGTRNILAITTTVQCVAGVRRLRGASASRPSCCRAIRTSTTWSASSTRYGCGVAIDAPDAVIPIRTLRNISLNPNFGGEVMVVSLGCEKLQPERLLPPGSIAIRRAQRRRRRRKPNARRRVPAGRGARRLHVDDRVDHGERAEQHLERLNARRRETVPASELVVGVQCGGSDAFSGVTANPAVGFCTDLLVRAGATVMFSEVTEVRDGIDQLTSRAVDAEVAAAMIREMAWYDDYLEKGGVDRSANTTPGNKKGGLSNIVEKAMGSIVKSGSGADLGRAVARREAATAERA